MKIFGDIKEKMKSLYADGAAKMQICMLGARGVGKTSVLTSMFHDINRANSDTELMLTTCTDETFTREVILEKHRLLKDAFHCADDSLIMKDAGIAGDFSVSTYHFQFGLKGKKDRIDLHIRDYPGEYVITEPEKVKAYIRESNAVIVAIDAPHLMEEGGAFNEVKNRVSEITAFFNNAFEGLNEDKLILLVPLKCEKYYREGQLDALTKKVEEVYAPLLEFFANGEIKKHIVCAITPILTMGEVVFDSFERESDGSIKLIHDEQEGDLPVARYRFTSANAVYRPKYCEQPLCYLLSFVVKLYYRTKDQQVGVLRKFLNLFKLFPDDPSLLMEIDRFGTRKVVGKDGYKIVQGNRKV